MDTQNFLKKLVITIPSAPLSEADSKKIQYEGWEKFIYSKLSSAQFKGSTIPEELEKKVKEKISLCVKGKKPIHVTVPFGGYKKWQLPTYPNPDWAEVFNLVQLRDYLYPISLGYPYGVILEYFSDEIFVSRMNNYPQKDLDSYNKQFEELVAWFGKYVPNNFEIRSSKIRDQISQKEIFTRFDKTIKDLRKQWKALPEKERNFRLRKSERNYKADLSSLPIEEKEKILLDSTLVHDAFIFGDWDKDAPWAFDKDMIALGFRYTGTWGIHVKSSRSSTVQFWIGIGALEKRENKYMPTIFTYEQYLKRKKSLAEESINVFPSTFSNLSKIPIPSV